MARPSFPAGETPELPVSARNHAPQRFRPPRVLSAIIDRPFLLSKVTDGIARQIVFIHAPPGFGKTTLMKAVYEGFTHGDLPAPHGERIGRCGWLTVSDRHADRGHFLSDLEAALGLSGTVAPVSVEEILERLDNRRDLTILFLDDINRMTVRGLPDLLGRLLLNSPDRLRIVCASMYKPALPLARLKVRGNLVEIAASDLSFSRAEIKRLVRQGLHDADIDLLARLTSGWPALILLAAELMPSLPTGDWRRIVSDGHADFFEYIEEVLLRDMSRPLRRALKCASVIGEFPIDLLSSLAPEPLSAEDMSTIAGSAPLIEPLGSEDGWYRLHPMLCRCLLREARTDIGLDEALLHSRAAAWFARNGILNRAVSHAVSCGDFDMAREIIDRAGGVTLFIRSGRLVLEQLIDNIPVDIIYLSPSLTLCYALILAKRNRLAAARELIELLKKDWEDGRESCRIIGRSALEQVGGLIDIYQDRNMDGKQIARLEKQAAALPPQAAWELGWIYNHLCIAYMRNGDIEQARSSALKSLCHYREERTAYAQVFLLVHLATLDHLSGNFSAASQRCRKAGELIQSTQWADRNLAAIRDVAMADILYLRDEIGPAERMLSDALSSISGGEGWVDVFSRLFALLALCRLHIAGFAAATAVIDRAENVAIERSLPRLKIAADILRTDILIKAGMLESAMQVSEKQAKSFSDPAHAEIWTWRERIEYRLARARLDLERNRAAEALSQLESIMAESAKIGSAYHLLTAEIVALRTAWRDGDQARALKYLQSAIARARAHDATRPFLDEGADLAATIRAVARRFGLKMFSTDAVEFMSRIVGHGLRRPPQLRCDHTSVAANGLLSPRESEVLRLLDNGSSNKEMARALNLSEATVKFHLKNIYEKLGVSRRTMAQSVARQLQLVPCPAENGNCR